jgi:hypothetical protein
MKRTRTAAIVASLLFMLPHLLAAQLQWEPANRGLEGGDVLGFVETADGRLIAATGVAIYRYDRSSNRWDLVHARSGHGALQFAVAASGEIFVTGDPGLRSSHDGRTWTALDRIVHIAAADPSGGVVLFSDSARSTDLGATWTPVTTPECIACVVNLGGGHLVDFVKGVAVSPDMGDTWVYADGFNEEFRSAVTIGTLVVATGAKGVWRSADSGVSWQRMSTLAGHEVERTSDGELLLSSFGNAQRSANGLYRSVDSGATWSHVSTGGFRQVFELPSGEIWAGRHPGPARSTNGGATWTTLTMGIHERGAYVTVDAAGSFYALAPTIRFNPKGNYNHYELFHSNDDGATWRKLLDSVSELEPLFPIGSFAVVTVTEHDSTVGTRLEVATRVTTDHGTTWRTAAAAGIRPMAGEHGSVGANDGDVAAISLSTSSSNNLIVTTDGGVTWIPRRTPATPASIAITPSGRIVIGTTMKTIVASDDAGATWTKLTEGRSMRDVIAPTDNHILASTFDRDDTTNHYDYSSDRGATWTTTLAANPFGNLRRFGTMILAPVYLPIAGSFDGEVAIDRSSDWGATWTRSTLGELRHRLQEPTFSPTGAVLALKREGLAYSRDYGVTVELIDTLLWPGEPVTNDRVIIASNRGLFRAFLPGVSTVPTRMTLGTRSLSIAPIPASDRLVVDAGDLAGTLSIVDVAGRIVRTVDVDRQPQVIDISELGTGVYIVRAARNGEVIAARFVVVRP